MWLVERTDLTLALVRRQLKCDLAPIADYCCCCISLLVCNPWPELRRDRQEVYQVRVATATKRSPRFCGAQLNPSHGTGAWTLQEL